MERFPVEAGQVRVSTAAYQAERDLDSLMYQDSGMYRNQQYGKAEAVTLRTMYEEIPILWDQELKYRPSFSVVDQTVTMPVLLEKICGVKDGQTNAYWLELKKLVTPDTLVVRSVPWLAGTDANPIKPFATQFLKNGRLRPEYSTQRKVVDRFPGKDEKSTRLREGLLSLLDDVLFIEDPRHKGRFHPRISAHATFAYRSLDEARRHAFDRLYDDFFYRRHNRFWKDSALHKLPSLLGATGMLACGEDLGMIPDCVPETMRELQILSLEIQRMSKMPGEWFADPARYPYHSVCSTSTHDMAPLRAWWEEDSNITARFYHDTLGCDGTPPTHCETWIAQRVINMHLNAPSMLAILPLQDWLALDGLLRRPDPAAERINVPAVHRYYWRYRMHLTLEELLEQEAFNKTLREMISCSGRQ